MYSTGRRAAFMGIGLIVAVAVAAAVLLHDSVESEVQLVTGSSPTPTASTTPAVVVGGATIEDLTSAIAVSRDVYRAQEAAIQECMKDQGFSYEPVPLRAIDLGLRGRYGVTEVPRVQGPLPQEQSNLGAQGLNASQREVWDRVFFGQTMTNVDVGFGGSLGLPSDGCLAKGQLQADPNWVEREKVSFQLSILMGEALERSAEVAEVDDAKSDWRQCMVDRGHAVQGLDETAARVAAGEQDVATASSSCDDATGLARTWRAADLEVQRRLLRENPAVVGAAMELAS